MSSFWTSLAVTTVVFVGGLTGLALQRLLPETHLTKDTHAVILLGTGMLSVLASLVLGLQITSAKNSYDATDTAVRNYAAELILLSEVLRDYGARATTARDSLRNFTEQIKQDIWPPAGSSARPYLDSDKAGRALEQVRSDIRALDPQVESDPAKSRALQQLQNAALDINLNLLRQRWIMIEKGEPTVQKTVFYVLVAWIVTIFASFGLNAPRNGTVVTAFLVCSLAIGGAVFLILEMNRPLEGVMRISREPIELALCHMEWKLDPVCDQKARAAGPN
jgi:hypothetical protein